MTSTHTRTHSYSAHPDDHWTDEVRMITVPRWKTSGLSGDEWRFSYRVELWRKGRVWAQHNCGSLLYASMLATSALHLEWYDLKDSGWEVLIEPRSDHAQCFNPGCMEMATVEYRVKHTYCSSGHPGDTYGDMRRRFCEVHQRRGDCAFDDADPNYERVDFTPMAVPTQQMTPTVDEYLTAVADSLHTPPEIDAKLADALAAAGIDALADRARRGEFSDYDSPHTMPKMVLHGLLHEIGTPGALEVDAKLINGEFDG